jgi:hypothetical protein
MGFLFSGIFWGVVLILLGITVVINIVFHVHIPFMRLLFAVILIYLGLKVLMGPSWHGRHGWSNARTTAFCESNVEMNPEDGECKILFGKGYVDATIPLTDANKRMKVNTVFGHSTVAVSSMVPTKIKIDAAFSGVNLPNGSVVSFGDYVYTNKAFSDTAAYRTIDVSVVFGGCDIIEKNGQ